MEEGLKNMENPKSEESLKSAGKLKGEESLKSAENPKSEKSLKSAGNLKGEENPNGKAGEMSISDGHGSLLTEINCAFPGKREDIRAYSGLTLAYIGDAVYDLIIRTVIVERANRSVNDLHHIAVKYVSANAQAKIVEALMESFTEEEMSVYRRGRNSKPHTTAKNADVAVYLKATGFEAVLGRLYLAGRMDRILELIKKGIALAGMEI